MKTVKMKVLVMNCSPVRNGAAEIVNIVTACLEKKHDVKNICIDDYDIKFCKGCRKCHTTAKCVQKDDVNRIIEQYEWADVIISVSPLYWADIPGQFKAFIDRCTPWCNTHEPHAKISSGRVIGNNDIITIDLSPQAGNIWGDYARTIIMENGKVVEDIGLIENLEWKRGLQMEEKLHTELLRFATKETTFEKLYYHMNEFIVENGFVNLDFMGNLGHSIVKTKGDRVYIEKGNMTKLGDVKYFTFEPHIAFPDSKYGYKKENIYYFDENGLIEL